LLGLCRNVGTTNPCPRRPDYLTLKDGTVGLPQKTSVTNDQPKAKKIGLLDR